MWTTTLGCGKDPQLPLRLLHALSFHNQHYSQSHQGAEAHIIKATIQARRNEAEKLETTTACARNTCKCPTFDSYKYYIVEHLDRSPFFSIHCGQPTVLIVHSIMGGPPTQQCPHDRPHVSSVTLGEGSRQSKLSVRKVYMTSSDDRSTSILQHVVPKRAI